MITLTKEICRLAFINWVKAPIEYGVEAMAREHGISLERVGTVLTIGASAETVRHRREEAKH